MDLRGPNLENILPKANLSAEMFMQQRIRLFKYLHLLFEDLRLISQRSEEREKLCYFLMTYTIFLNVEDLIQSFEPHAPIVPHRAKVQNICGEV